MTALLLALVMQAAPAAPASCDGFLLAPREVKAAVKGGPKPRAGR